MATYNALMPYGRKLAMRRGRWLATGLLSSLVLLAPADDVRAQVLPGGFTSVAGGGSISYSLPGTLGINQPTSTPFIGNWQSFDIGAGGLVTFNQPSATAVGLNRVIDVNRSELSGALDIDGVGVLVNAGGAIFSSGSLVTARSFIASTLDITNTDFVDGNYLFEANDADVIVVDGGASVIANAGGSIALIGSAVENRGAIEALGGSINLVSAATVQLDIDANGLVGIVGAPAAAATADIKNSGVLDATGGTVSLYSRGLAGGDIFNSGIIRANLLTGGANGSAVFEGANYIVELGNFDSGGDFALANEQALSVTGTVTSTSGNVALETKLGAMTIDGDVSGDDVALRSAGALRINQSVTGASLVLAAGGDIVIDGTVEGTLTTLTTRRLIVGSSAAHPDALLQSDLTIGSGMTLAGHGTVGSTTIASGGTIAPGSSIGTLKVDGDLFVEDGARYELEVDPSGTASDLISVSGSATLNGGSVAHIGALGAYRPGSTYRILTAGTGLVGEFTAVTSDFAFLTPEFVYDYTAFTVDLMLARNGVDFADKAATRNQLSTAGGIESLGSGNDVYDAVAALPGDDALIRAVFDQLSGEVHASLKGVALDDSRFVREAALQRLYVAFDGVGAMAAPVMSYADGEPVLAPAATDGWAVWGHGFGSWGHWNGDGNSATLKRDAGGFFVGADGLVGDNWRLGLLGGYSRSTFQVDDRHSSGASNNFHLGVYGGRQWGDLAFRSGLAYTWHDVSTDRSVAVPCLSEHLEADYNAGTTQVFGELGYDIRRGQAAFEPFANLAYVNLSTDGFSETGGAAALISHGDTTDATFTTLGLRIATDFEVNDGVKTTARGTVGWRHAFGDTTPLSSFAFADGNAFTIAGVPIARDAAVLEVALDFRLAPAALIGVSYDGQFGDGVADNAVRARLDVSF